MSQKPLPLGEVSPKVTERARTLTEMSEHSDNIALIKAFDYRCIPSLLSHACPLRRSAPALPKGEPLQNKKRGAQVVKSVCPAFCSFLHRAPYQSAPRCAQGKRSKP